MGIISVFVQDKNNKSWIQRFPNSNMTVIWDVLPTDTSFNYNPVVDVTGNSTSVETFSNSSIVWAPLLAIFLLLSLVIGAVIVYKKKKLFTTNLTHCYYSN